MTDGENVYTEYSVKEKKNDFKRVCGKIGFSISAFYICKITCSMIMTFIYASFEELGTTVLYGISMFFSCLFSYLIPLLITMILFGSEGIYEGKVRQLYKCPKKSARVFAAFPAIYGLGMAVNILTLLAFYLISLFSRENVVLEKSLQSANRLPDNIYCALMLTFVSVIIAPLVEEFWVRGILYDALKPYGDGIALLISSVVFGLMHGNLQMLFYTTALGLALGYIRYATGSIFASTVIHAGVNLISSVISLFLSTDALKDVQVEPSAGDEFITVLFYACIGAVLILMLVGIVSFFKRLPALRRVKINNAWPDVKPAGKLFIFFSSIPVLIMLALAVDAHFGQWITRSLFNLIY